jgi:hypothetical protein
LFYTLLGHDVVPCTGIGLGSISVNRVLLLVKLLIRRHLLAAARI